MDDPWDSMSDEEIRELAAALRCDTEGQLPVFLRAEHGADGSVKRFRRMRPGVLPLPRRVRARLAVRRAADSIGIWLAWRCPEAARRWWKALGMLR